MKKIWILILMMVAFVEANVATIKAIRGDATLIHKGESQAIYVGTILAEHDEIHTQKNCKLQIVFVDKTVISLGQKTDFKIDAYLFDEKNPKARFSVRKGFFKSITGRIGKMAPKQFKIKTANATIGVRGTTIIGEVTPTVDLITCTVGQIVVSTQGGSKVVNAGERTIVQQLKAPKAPQRLNHVLLKQLDQKSDPKVAPLSTEYHDIKKKEKSSTSSVTEAKKSDDFEPWEDELKSLPTLQDIEHTLGERRPSYEGRVTAGSTSYGAIDKERSRVNLGFDLGTGDAQGTMHIEDTKANVHDIDLAGKIKGDGNFDFNSHRGYDGGASGSLSGTKLEHANGDFNFDEHLFSGKKNTIQGTFETTHKK